MEIHELRKEIEYVEDLIGYLKQLYGELRKTPLEDMQQRIDMLTDPLARRFSELVTFFFINELKGIRDKSTNPIVRKKIDALLFFMERKITEEYIKKLMNAEIINVNRSGKADKSIISEGLSIVGYANPYLGKRIEEEISIVYGYVFNEKGIRIKVDLREKEMKISPDANETDIIYGCSHILEFAIRGYEPELWDEYKELKMRYDKPRLSGYIDTEFNRKLLGKGILTDSAASRMFAEDFGLYALWKSKKIEKNLDENLWNFFNEDISNYEIPSIDDIILIY